MRIAAILALSLVAAVGAAVASALASDGDVASIRTPTTVTDCRGPVRVILDREDAIAFLEARDDPVPTALRRNDPPVEQVVIELREGSPGGWTPYAPEDPLRTDC